MCGIVGYIGTHRAVPIILEGLKRLEYRGYDSAGLAVYCDDNQLAVRRAQGKLRNLEEAIRLNPIDGAFGIGHTRWATHGRPTEENATLTQDDPTWVAEYAHFKTLCAAGGPSSFDNDIAVGRGLAKLAREAA